MSVEINWEIKFVDAVLAGDALIEDIDDYVAAWHDLDSNLSVYDFLGLSQEEYGMWVEEEETLRFVIAARYNNTTAIQEIKRFEENYSLAARGMSSEMGGEISDWLRRTGRM